MLYFVHTYVRLLENNKPFFILCIVSNVVCIIKKKKRQCHEKDLRGVYLHTLYSTHVYFLATKKKKTQVHARVLYRWRGDAAFDYVARGELKRYARPCSAFLHIRILHSNIAPSTHVHIYIYIYTHAICIFLCLPI